MASLSSLPRTLLALSLVGLQVALPALAVTASLPQTSFNDQFRAIVIRHRAHQPELPLCCLKPLPSVNPPEGPEDVLLSFEEWKSKHVHSVSQSVPAKPNEETSDSTAPSTPNVQNTDVPPTDAQWPPAELSHSTSDDTLPPYFRIPITDRFNYASVDCSARIHTTHKSAKSASSILLSTKDKYMLSPCSADDQFVVVELCDDIRIDTVQLANFEFFSGVFKDFSVSVAKTYTGTNEGWTPAGTYRAKNIRGVQSFHLPTSLRGFYRYIRIDFHSHYGHEYYCPVSLLRVYGLTHLEEWKWDTWQAESRARLKDFATQPSSTVGHPAASDATSPKVASNSSTNVSTARLVVAEALSNATHSSPVEIAGTPTHEASSSHSLLSANSRSQRRSSVDVLGDGTSAASIGDREQALPTQSPGVHSVTEAISSLLSLSSPVSVVLPSSPTTEHLHLSSHDSETHAVTTLSSQLSNPSVSPIVQQTATHAATAQWSGESIYRTIMNRLTILEANHTLYARYVEEQTAGVREVLRKLNEEVGRLESISRMQAQMYQRTVHEWERQRLRLELEHGELLSRVNYLSDEVVLEKRLGIAQLCLLLAVLVFIGLTRGAPSTHHPPPMMHRSTREWGVRNLSFGSSTDSWNPLGRRSRSPVQQGEGKKHEKAPDPAVNNHLLFLGSADSLGPKPESHPTTHSSHASRAFKLTTVPAGASSHKRAHTSSAFRTPTKSRPLVLADPHTLPRAESMARSHSSSTSSHLHVRSPKRWARTAHLHEIKVFRERRGSGGGKRSVAYKDRENGNENENENENEGSLGDVFNVNVHGNVKSRPQEGFRRGVVRSSEESADADVWVDTDVEDDVSVGSERVIVLNSPECDVFGELPSA